MINKNDLQKRGNDDKNTHNTQINLNKQKLGEP